MNQKTYALPSTSKELAALMAERGFPLPEGWSKMPIARKQAAVNKAALDHAGVQPMPHEDITPTKRGMKAVIAHGVAAMAAGLSAVGNAAVEAAHVVSDAATGLDKAAKKNAKRKVYSDKNYVRTTRKMRRVMKAYGGGAKSAQAPEKMTRQMRRRAQIDGRYHGE